MKNAMVLLIVLISALVSCEEDNLTEIKYDGTGGISCVADGKVLKSGSNNDLTYCKFTVLDDGIIILGISFSDNTSQWVFETVSLVIYDVQIDDLVGTTYYLSEKTNSSSYGIYGIGGLEYKTNNNNTGDFTISYYDPEKKVIAGNFSFRARGNGEVKKIRFGRFDLPINDPE